MIRKQPRRFLAEAGYPDGFDLNLYISNTPTRVGDGNPVPGIPAAEPERECKH